jgi:hypothetical protein
LGEWSNCHPSLKQQHTLNLYWKLLIGAIVLYYGYIFWVLKIKKNPKVKKDSENDSYLQKKDIFVNNTSFEQTDLGDILDQVVEETENNSKLLDAFKKGSSDEDDINSLTRKKHEKLKVIRSKDSVDDDSTDSES